MKTDALNNIPDFTLRCGDDAAEITGIYCGDLLSHVMGQALCGNVWCTVMGNINTIAVASLTDAAAVILCNDIPFTDDMRAKAEANGVTVFSTPLAEFDAALTAAKAAGLA